LAFAFNHHELLIKETLSTQGLHSTLIIFPLLYILLHRLSCYVLVWHLSFILIYIFLCLLPVFT